MIDFKCPNEYDCLFVDVFGVGISEKRMKQQEEKTPHKKITFLEM